MNLQYPISMFLNMKDLDFYQQRELKSKQTAGKDYFQNY